VALAGAAVLLGGAGRAPREPAAPAGPAAARPISRMDTPWWKARHQAVLKRLKQGPVDLLLVGDSITQDLERRGPIPEMDFDRVWQRFYAPRNAVNLGFKGDSTAHLLWRLQNGELDGIAPKAAQVLIGANNFGRVRWGAADTLAGIEAVLAEMRKRLPRTRVLLLGVLPSVRSAWVDENTATLNRMLAERFRQGGEVTYADVSSFFRRNGAVDTEAFYDGKLSPPEPALHPTAQAHARVAEYLAPILGRLMGA
jgi:lysophospholipase L1-like esterase